MATIIDTLDKLFDYVDNNKSKYKFYDTFENTYNTVKSDYNKIKILYINNSENTSHTFMNNCNKLLSSIPRTYSVDIIYKVCKKIGSYLYYLNICTINDDKFINSDGSLKDDDEYNPYSYDFFWIQGNSNRYHSFKNLLHLQYEYRSQYKEICELFGEDNLKTNGYKHRYNYNYRVYDLKIIDGLILIKCYHG